MLLRYNPRKGWFRVIRWLSGTVDFYSGVTLPDRDGCLEREFVIGPFATPSAARNAWSVGSVPLNSEWRGRIFAEGSKALTSP